MDINRMRLGLTYIFKESKKISKESKIQIINFIEEADMHQLKVLAMDGEIVTYKIDEKTRNIIDKRFNVSENITKKLKQASLIALKTLTNK